VGLAERLSLVQRARARQVVAAPLALVGHAVQRRRAAERGLRRPPGIRLRGGGDRLPRVLAIALGDRAEVLAGGGAERAVLRPVQRRAPVAADEHAGERHPSPLSYRLTVAEATIYKSDSSCIQGSVADERDPRGHRLRGRALARARLRAGRPAPAPRRRRR